MSAWKCPKCKAEFPEHNSWGGGGDYVTIGCHCKKCGHRWVSKSTVYQGKEQK